MSQRETIYEMVGGMPTFYRLVDAFYSHIEADPFLRPMFPKHFHCAREHLALFLGQFFGGPEGYMERRGSPRLRMRHQPFKIGQAERDAWLSHMLAALDEAGIPEPARTIMQDYFSEASTFLINQPAEGCPIALREQATAGIQAVEYQGEPAAEIGKRWAALDAMERALDTIDAGSLSSIRPLLEDPALRETLSRDRLAYQDVLTQAGCTNRPELVAEVKGCLEREPDLISLTGCRGATLLHEAAGAWSDRFAEVLLEMGSDPNARARSGRTPLYYAANRTLRRDDRDAENGPNVVALLLRHGADANLHCGIQQVTALHMAARRGNEAIARRLIEHGADLEARDKNGETPLRRAVNCDRLPVAALLLAQGASVDTQDNKGQTPLQAARSKDIRELLLQHGATAV